MLGEPRVLEDQDSIKLRSDDSVLMLGPAYAARYESPVPNYSAAPTEAKSLRRQVELDSVEPPRSRMW